MSDQQRTAEEQRDDFEYWLADMDDALERFFQKLPPAVRSKLDFSPESLDVLEGWILENYASTDDLLKPEAKEPVDDLARYVGEVYRKTLGGIWDIRLDDPKYAYYGLPELTGFSEKPSPIAPHTLVTASADRRTGVYLRTVLENTRKRLGK
jgi:hypothetical protein